MSAPVLLQLTERPLDDDEIAVTTTDDLLAPDRCSCSVGDDQPY